MFNFRQFVRRSKLPRVTPSLAINVVGFIIMVYLCVILGQTVERNYQLDKQISSQQSQIQQLKANNDQLNFNLQYYQTDAFRQREARAKLGLLAPGENEIILPATTPAPKPADIASKKVKRSSWQQWSDFLHGRL